MFLNIIYKKKNKFVVREMGNELILVPLAGNVAKMNEMFTMNETGKFIWENIQENTTTDDIVNLLTQNFDIDETTARRDTENFVERIFAVLLKN